MPGLLSSTTAAHAAGFTRAVALTAIARGNTTHALHMARLRKPGDQSTSEVLKSAIDPIDETDAAGLRPTNAGRAFVRVVGDASIIGALLRYGARLTPIDVAVIAASPIAALTWHGTGSVVPVLAGNLRAQTLARRVVGGIMVISDALAHVIDDDPAAEAYIRDLAVDAAQRGIDATALGAAPGDDNQPAGLLHDAVSVTSTGNTLAAITADMRALADAMVAAGGEVRRPLILLHPSDAVAMSGLGAADVRVGIAGTFVGCTQLTSPGVERSASSGSRIVMIGDPSGIAVAVGSAEFSLSREATLQMSDTPAVGAQPQLALWPNDLSAIKLALEANWSSAPGMVGYIDGLNI